MVVSALWFYRICYFGLVISSLRLLIIGITLSRIVKLTCDSLNTFDQSSIQTGDAMETGQLVTALAAGVQFERVLC